MTASAPRSLGISVVIFILALGFGALGASLAMRLALGVISLHFAWRACAGRDGSGHPMGLYLLVSGLYVFAAFSEVALFGNRLNLDPTLMGDLADMGVCFLICAAAGYLVFREEPGVVKSVNINTAMISAAMYISIALFIICSSITLIEYGTSIGSISRSDLYANENSLLTVLRGFLAVSFSVVAAALVAYEGKTGVRLRKTRLQLFLTLAAYVLVDLLILGDRRLPLMAMLGVGALMLPKRFTWPQIVSATVLSLIFFMYGFVRNTPPSQWIGTITSGDIFLAFSPASTEFGGLAIIGEAIGNFDHALAGFPSYGDAFLQLFPRALVASRPLSPTEWFIQNYFPDLAASGASYAFNQVIEARMNAGIFGVLAVGFLTGAMIAWICRVRYRGIQIGVPLCANVFCFSMRMDLVSIIRTGIIASIGIALVTGIVGLLQSRKVELSSARRSI